MGRKQWVFLPVHLSLTIGLQFTIPYDEITAIKETRHMIKGDSIEIATLASTYLFNNFIAREQVCNELRAQWRENRKWGTYCNINVYVQQWNRTHYNSIFRSCHVKPPGQPIKAQHILRQLLSQLWAALLCLGIPSWWHYGITLKVFQESCQSQEEAS